MIFNNISLEDIMYRLPAIIIGFTLHEFMHAYVADRLGDPTPRSHGRVTLNPLAHIDWIGFFFILFAGFGWAKPVPTVPRNYKNYKKGRLLVSLAGPFTNLALAFIGLCVYYFGVNTITTSVFWINILDAFVYINILLFAFNMLPVPPLDGFTLLEIAINPSKLQALHKVRNYGLFVLVGLSFLGVLGIYINFVYDIVLKASFWLFGGIDMLLGLF